ncbi:MAG: Bug family tripartite tricarboxylate transporter substrate binding protein, partial [Burkholderiales bacterium]
DTGSTYVAVRKALGTPQRNMDQKTTAKMTPYPLKFLLFALCIATTAMAHAQVWPAKSVRLICSIATGTAPDLVLRMVADRLSKTVGRQVFVENILGGAGHIAGQAAARAAPDGHTFFLAGAGILVIDRFLFKNLPFDADRDFTPFAKIYDSGALTIAVNPQLPVKNVAELIALARAQPGKLSYGVDGTLSPIIGNYFVKLTGIDMVGIPYKGPGQMLQDAAENRTQVVIVSLQGLDTYRRNGKLRVIGIGSQKRYPGLEEVATIGETLPGFRAGGIGILVAPTGTSADILDRMRREIDPIVRDPEYQKRLLQFGFIASDAGSPQSIAETIRGERELWAKIAATVGFQPQ